MADHITVPGDASLKDGLADAAWAPLREPLFRSLWIAAVVSYTGTWMQNVGAGWLMTQIIDLAVDGQPGAGRGGIPVFLVVLPAGALADMVDRRRLLLFTQSWMVAAAAALGVLTLLHAVTPWMLLLFTVLLGVGRGAERSGVAGDYAGGRLSGTACLGRGAEFGRIQCGAGGRSGAGRDGSGGGGIGVVVSVECGIVLWRDLFLCKWKRAPHEPLATTRVRDAIAEGFRYVRGAPQVRSVLIRTGAFSVGATSLLALLPVICQPHGAQGYGFLLTCFGLGALAGAALLPRLRLRYSVDGLVAGATVVFAAMTLPPGRCMCLSGCVWYCLRRARRGSAFWPASTSWRRPCVRRGCGRGRSPCTCWCCKEGWLWAARFGESWRRAKAFPWRWPGRHWRWWWG